MKTAVGSTARLERKMTRDEELEQSRRTLPKNLIRLLSYRIIKASGFRDLLSRSPVHAGAPDGVNYGGDASSERWKNPRGAQRKILGNMGHDHVACPSRLQQSTIRLAVTRPSRTR
jgi:hypothetical protein